jgi:hypothetical protein
MHFNIIPQWLESGFLNTETRFQSQVSSCGICGENKTEAGIDFSPNTSVFPCQYRTMNTVYAIMHPLQTLYKLSNCQLLYLTVLKNVLSYNLHLELFQLVCSLYVAQIRSSNIRVFHSSNVWKLLGKNLSPVI